MKQQTNSPPHRARKRFGQNFLQDEGIIHRIVKAINPKQTDHLLEIGPGKGAITASLLEHCPNLQVVELDRDLVPLLQEKFSHYPQFRVHQGDILKCDLSSLTTSNQPLRVVGNLPYNISTPLIFHILQQLTYVSDMHFMLQKEVVERLAAQPNEKAYGRLGIMVQYFCEVEMLIDVPPEAFIPAPKVDSAVVRLKPHQTIEYPANDVDLLSKVVKQAFGQRRKTIRNNLKPIIDPARLEALKIDPKERPENLSLKDYITISNSLSSD